MRRVPGLALLCALAIAACAPGYYVPAGYQPSERDQRALTGGVIGAGLLFAVERSGALGVADDGRIAALDQKIATLAPKDALAALDRRIGANEATLRPLPEAIRSADAAAKDALQKAGSASASPPADGSAPAAALPQDLVARLDGLDQAGAQLELGRRDGLRSLCETLVALTYDGL